MDEEKEQKNGQAKNVKSVLNEGVKQAKEQSTRKFFRTVIIAILPKLLLFISIAFASYLLIASIIYWDKDDKSIEAKESSSSAIVFSSGSAKINKITVNLSNISNDGAYNLEYKFKNEDGKVCTEEEAIKIIKRNLLKENEKIDLSQFSDSELKVIGTLMNNGLDTSRYNEEQLKALVIFVKSDIAGQSFNCINDPDKKVTVEELRDNDKVYGILELHKTRPTTNGYEEIKLDFIPYSQFKSMVKNTDKNVLNKFSVTSNGKVVIAKESSQTIKYTYLNGSGNVLSEVDKAKLDFEDIEEENSYKISEFEITTDYKKYIKKYTANYGFLLDLLIATGNVDFCLEIAELALNSKIIINLREEETTTYTKENTNYIQTTLVYDYVDYEVSAYDEISSWETIASGTGSPRNSTVPSTYGWNSGLGYSQTGEYGGTYVYNWKKAEDEYQLKHIKVSGNERWSLLRLVKEITDSSSIIEKRADYLIVGGHEGTLNEDYTAKEEFNYSIIKETSSSNYKYDIDISEIDCWYLTYKRPYASPDITTTTFSPPADVEGQYPQEATVVLEKTKDKGIIDADRYVQAFTKKWTADNEECVVTALARKQRTKSSSKVQEYEGYRTTYKFGDESNLDTTKVEFKNLKYIGENPAFTDEGKIGFLYIYNQYITDGIDLCLQNDAEQKLFELLEQDNSTEDLSQVMRFLLYIYDGINRGVTDLDKNFKVIDMSLASGNAIGASAFGCPITKEEFIEATENYQGDSILATLAELFYDICTLPEYNVNPCLAYVWAAFESGWGRSALQDKNLFQMGTYTDQTSGFKYNSYEDSIRAFCQWCVDAADPSTNLYKFCSQRAEEYVEVNSKFKGSPDNNIYALLSTFANVGYIHNGNTRACIKMTYDYLNDGIYECNHKDEEPVTMQERADYVDYLVTCRVNLARTIFGNECFIGHSSIVEAAYAVADHFMNSGVDVHYAAAHKNGNSIVLPDQHNIEACYDLPIKWPNRYGIVCTTFVNLALWKSGLIDTETINTFAIHSPIRSALSMEGLDGWEIITDVSELQEGDIVYTAEPAHTWIYMEGNKMLDQTYCVINANGYDSRGVLKDASWGIAGFTKAFRYVGK